MKEGKEFRKEPRGERSARASTLPRNAHAAGRGQRTECKIGHLGAPFVLAEHGPPPQLNILTPRPHAGQRDPVVEQSSPSLMLVHTV
eukprot:3555266-Pyramimonas_sp.AAC.1